MNRSVLGIVLFTLGCSSTPLHYRIPRPGEAGEVQAYRSREERDAGRLINVARLAEALRDYHALSSIYPTTVGAIELGSLDSQCFDGGFKGKCRASAAIDLIEPDPRGLPFTYESNGETFELRFTLEAGYVDESAGVQFTEPIADWLDMHFQERAGRLPAGHYLLTPGNLERIAPP